MLAAATLVACGATKKVGRALEGPPKRTKSEQRRFDAAVKRGDVLIGMTKSEVRKSRGDPKKTDSVERYGGKVRRWQYSWDEVYFDAKGLVVGTHTAYAR